MAIFEEQFTIAAPPETVWELLLDPERLRPCIPACEDLRVEDDRTWRLRLTVKVGFLSTTQNVRVTIIEADRPRRLVSIGHGLDMRLGSRTEMTNALDLTPLGPDATQVRYRSEVKVLGPLGSVGDGVMKAKVKQMAAEFASRVRAAVEGRA